MPPLIILYFPWRILNDDSNMLVKGHLMVDLILYIPRNIHTNCPLMRSVLLWFGWILTSYTLELHLDDFAQDQHGTHLGPTGPRLAPYWPHELCYLGTLLTPRSFYIWIHKGFVTQTQYNRAQLKRVYISSDLVYGKSCWYMHCVPYTSIYTFERMLFYTCMLAYDCNYFMQLEMQFSISGYIPNPNRRVLTHSLLSIINTSLVRFSRKQINPSIRTKQSLPA